MVVVAEGFLQYHEKHAMDIALTMNAAPKSFLRYVDDSHSRFEDIEKATMFKQILNDQDPDHLQYTMEVEDFEKTLNFLDLKIKNNNGNYEFSIHRKDAITNVQVKPHSGHDPKILKGIFTGFLNRAFTICQGIYLTDYYLTDEIEFLIRCFTENGYNEKDLRNMAKSYTESRQNRQSQHQDDLKIVSLPWVPGLSPKLRKSFRKVVYKQRYIRRR